MENKALQQAKDEVVKSKKYKDWEACINDQPNYMVESLMDEVYIKYAEIIERERWINVKDRLPENENDKREIDVLIFCKREYEEHEEVLIGWYDTLYETFMSIFCREDENINVTHWMYKPLPPAP